MQEREKVEMLCLLMLSLVLLLTSCAYSSTPTTEIKFDYAARYVSPEDTGLMSPPGAICAHDQDYRNERSIGSGNMGTL